jgi:hypothetical protein
MEKPPSIKRAAARTGTKPRREADAPARKDPEVTALMRDLEHPLKPELEKVRRLILGASPTISEAVKWKAPSFRTTDFFATMHLRATDGVQLIMHTGAKAKATAQTGVPVEAPGGLLKWLAKDRCLVSLGRGKALEANLPAFEALVREWIRWV